MDPPSATGLASNIIQFINFGTKIVSKGNQIYNSNDGKIAEHRELELVTNDLIIIQSKLKGCLRVNGNTRDLAEDDGALESLTSASSEIATTLLDRLNRVRAQGPHLRWKSLRQASKSVCSESVVDELAKRIATLKDELEIRNLVSLRYDT